MIVLTHSLTAIQIPLGQNIHATGKSNVTDGTYVGIMILCMLGALLAFFLVDAKKIIRPDGSKVIIMKHPTWKTEIFGLWECFKNDPLILLLFPMFWSSNWFYTYQFNGVNSAYFNTRTRALNSVLYWMAQIFGAAIFGVCLDLPYRRVIRARVGWCVLMMLTMAVYGGGYAFQSGYSRDTTSNDSNYTGKDWSDAGYLGPMFLYFFYGFFDASWQTCVYWFMGSLTNNGRKLANYAGFYKGIQSAGAAVMWRLDALNEPYMTELGSSWGLLAGSLIFALPLILMRVKDHVDVVEDLKFSDETMDDIVAYPSSALDHEGKPLGARELHQSSTHTKSDNASIDRYNNDDRMHNVNQAA